MATAYKQREGEAALSAVGGVAGWVRWEGRLARLGRRPGRSLVGAAPRARCWGREGGCNRVRGHPGHLLTLQEVKLRQQLHLTPYVQLTVAEGGAGSWPKCLEGLRSSGDPGMGAGKGQSPPAGQLPFPLMLLRLSLELGHLLWVTSWFLQQAGYQCGLVMVLRTHVSTGQRRRHQLSRQLHL